jgi:hypothetical protein
LCRPEQITAPVKASPEQTRLRPELLSPAGDRTCLLAAVENVVQAGGPRGHRVELEFGRRDIDLKLLRPGQALWKTDDPELTSRLRATFEGPTRRRIKLTVRINACESRPLEIEACTPDRRAARVRSARPLARIPQVKSRSELSSIASARPTMCSASSRQTLLESRSYPIAY